jgi:UPF0755 protein
MSKWLSLLRRFGTANHGNKNRLLRLACWLIPIIVVVSVALFYLVILTTPIQNRNENIIVEIARGESLPQISQKLFDLGVITNQRRFRLAAFILGRDKRLRAGRFNLKRVTNYYELVRSLADWDVNYVRVVVPEGYTSRQIARLLNQKLGTSSERFLTLVYDQNLVAQYGLNAPSLEGYLFPATYYFLEGDSPEFIIHQMVAKFKEMVTDSLQAVIRQQGRTLNQIITMASIVEGECMLNHERPIVASIYYNRLKRGMRLEACPTVQYLLDDAPRRLKLVDLKIESPYNTYLNYGLPPGPICNPGYKSILAAINPARTNYYFMVSNGDSTHSFASTYTEFLEAKKKLQSRRREIALSKGVKN